jgi:hypothetical protein
MMAGQEQFVDHLGTVSTIQLHFGIIEIVTVGSRLWTTWLRKFIVSEHSSPKLQMTFWALGSRRRFGNNEIDRGKEKLGSGRVSEPESASWMLLRREEKGGEGPRPGGSVIREGQKLKVI